MDNTTNDTRIELKRPVDYDFIIVNSSAGKDSQAMLDVIVQWAGEARNRIVVAHADLGRMEWPGTRELAEEQAKHYGIRFEVVKRTSQGGRELLAEVAARGKWPSSAVRYCTSYYKREPVLSLMTKLTREVRPNGLVFARPVRFLNCYGFRAEESPARAKRQPLSVNNRATNGKRTVHDYLPIHDWTETQVWQRINQAGTRHHHAYDMGMPRLSCRLCIFAPRAALLIAGRAHPELLAEYVAIEKKISHKFRVDQSLEEIQNAIGAGEQPGNIDGVWNM